MNLLVRKNLGYGPVMINLVFLPILFMFCIGRYQAEVHYPRIITINWADTTNLKENEWIHLLYDFSPPTRNYVEIILTGENKEDKFKLDCSRLMIREIIECNDSINGVKFIFGDTLNYGTMVKAIDILNQEKAERYIPINNSIYFFQAPSMQNRGNIITPLRVD